MRTTIWAKLLNSQCPDHIVQEPFKLETKSKTVNSNVKNLLIFK